MNKKRDNMKADNVIDFQEFVVGRQPAGEGRTIHLPEGVKAEDAFAVEVAKDSTAFGLRKGDLLICSRSKANETIAETALVVVDYEVLAERRSVGQGDVTGVVIGLERSYRAN
ncbi:MAG: hypothetical protein ACK4S4_09395 [Pyrinomonadaceae bacterium]